MVQSNIIDKVIEFFDPSAGLRRARTRTALSIVRGYEGATVGRRTDGWHTTGTSANTEIGPSLARLRNRSRDLERNNPHARKAIKVIVTNTVGTGIVPQAQGSRNNRAKAAMDAWKEWAETTECDADGHHDFYGLQALVWRTVALSGECLIRRRPRRTADGLSVPMQLQVLEPDFIDHSKDTLSPNAAGQTIVQGVVFDAIGRRVGYMLYQNHPGDVFMGGNQSSIVPAEDIIHVYPVERPGQVRGVPFAAPVIVRLRDFDEYEDAQLMRQKIAACFAVFVNDTDAGTVIDGKTNALPDTVEPGSIYLNTPGKSVEFSNPPGVDGYGDYSRISLQAVAAGFCVPYEALTGDLSNVNFSSGRMGWLEFHRVIEDWRWNTIIPRMCDGVWDWFISAAALSGKNVTGVSVKWTPPRREMIDPANETRAKVAAIRGGLLSLPEALRESGQDPDQVLAEIAETNDTLDKLGLTLESDPRRTTQSGQAQSTGTAPANDNNAGGANGA